MTDVHIKGYGVLPLDRAEAKVLEYLQGALDFARDGNWRAAHWLITGNGVLAATADAVRTGHEEQAAASEAAQAQIQGSE